MWNSWGRTGPQAAAETIQAEDEGCSIPKRLRLLLQAATYCVLPLHSTVHPCLSHVTMAAPGTGPGGKITNFRVKFITQSYLQPTLQNRHYECHLVGLWSTEPVAGSAGCCSRPMMTIALGGRCRCLCRYPVISFTKYRLRILSTVAGKPDIFAGICWHLVTCVQAALCIDGG